MKLLAALFVAALSTSAFAQSEGGENWPQFRGPAAGGVAVGKNLPDQWSGTQNVAWKTSIPGRGWSSPIVWGNRVFLTTAVNLGESEAPKKGLYFGGNRPEPRKSEHQFKVYCLDLQDGRVLWDRTVHRGLPQGAIHLKNSYASETPVADQQRVYCYFGNLGVFCFDHTGSPVWTKELLPHKTRYGWGTASSPVLHGRCLYLVNDNEEDSYLLALDKETGRELRRAKRDEKSNWSTPYVWVHGEDTEIVTPGTGEIRSYDLGGNVLWSLRGMSRITIATPFSSNGLLYVSSGFIMDKLRPLYAIRPGARGDITLADDETTNHAIAWCQRKAAPYNPSTLAYDGRLYVLYDRGLLACFDAGTGAPVYARQRIPGSRAFTSSPWAYDGKVFCINEDGVTFVCKAGDQFELLHTNPLDEDDMCLATPAIAAERLLIRTAARVYCIKTGSTCW